MSRTECIERAGHILILCIWVEKRLVDFCILKDRLDLVKELNENTSFSKEFIDLRNQYWKKSFKFVKEDFIKKYNPKESWRNHIESIYYWRNAIGHGHISLYRDYLLYLPDRDVENMLNILEPKEKEGQLASPTTLLIRFSDDDVYQKMLESILEIDQVYFNYIAKVLELNYEKIR